MWGWSWQYVYCTGTEVILNLTEVSDLPWLRFFRTFSSVVRQMPGYNSKRRGTDRTLPSSTLVCICVVRTLFFFFVCCHGLIVLFYVVLVCKCVLPPGDNPIAVNKYYYYYIRIIINHSLVSVTTFEGSSASCGNESKQVAQTSLSAIKTGNLHIW